MKSIYGSYQRYQSFQETGNFRKGQVGYDGETKNIVFYRDDEADDERYYIPISRLQTAEEQILWLRQITGKHFLTEKILDEFFICLSVLGLMPKGHI